MNTVASAAHNAPAGSALSGTPPPWYRQMWPWLLMLMPACAFFGGIATLYLAITSNNSLVVDDYYREGKAINQQLGRERMAASLGLQAELDLRSDQVVRVKLSAAAGDPPQADALVLKLIHPVHAERDHNLRLLRQSPGQYAAAAPTAGMPGSADAVKGMRWTVHLEDAARQWRLAGSITDPTRPLALVAGAR